MKTKILKKVMAVIMVQALVFNMGGLNSLKGATFANSNDIVPEEETSYYEEFDFDESEFESEVVEEETEAEEEESSEELETDLELESFEETEAEEDIEETSVDEETSTDAEANDETEANVESETSEETETFDETKESEETETSEEVEATAEESLVAKATPSDIDDLNKVVGTALNADSIFSVENDVMTLLKDAVLDESLKIEKDTTINLNSFKLSIEKDDYVLNVKNAALTIKDDSKNGGIVGSANMPAIYAESADLYLYSINISTTKANNIRVSNNYTIESNNSNIIVDGANIYGKDGADNEKKYGAEGGAAIYAKMLDNSKKVKVVSGVIKGGRGGDGIGEVIGNGGNAFCLNEEFYADDLHFIYGGDGSEGGGDGGCAVIIEGNGASEENLVIGDNVKLYGGDAGLGIKKNKNKLFGATLPSYYDLRDQGVVTSLKHQGQTGLCNTFANMAMAEAKMLLTYPEWCETHKNPSTNEVDFSEAGGGYFLRFHPSDPLGNAGQSYDEIKPTSNYKKLGSGYRDYSNFYSTWRGLQQEDTMPFNGGELQDSYDEQLARQAVVYGTNLKYYSLKNENREAGITNLKNAIYEHGPCVISITHHSTNKDYSKKVDSGSFGGTTRALYVPEGDSAKDKADGVHAIMVLGWDDNYPASNFASANQPPADGAFLCKNSHQVWNWISYYQNFDSGNYFYYVDYVPADTYDNLYYYDGGNDTQITVKNTGCSVAFVAKKDKEEVKAVSFITYGSAENVNVQVYKFNTEDYISNLGNTCNKFTKVSGTNTLEKTVNLHNGVNFITFDETLALDNGDKFVVKLSSSDKFSIPLDRTYTDDWYNYCHYYTTVADKSYMPSGSTNKLVADRNIRLKVITNDIKGAVSEEPAEESTQQSEQSTEQSTEDVEDDSEGDAEDIEEEIETSVIQTIDENDSAETSTNGVQESSTIAPPEYQYGGNSSGSGNSSGNSSGGYSTGLAISASGQLVLENQNLNQNLHQEQTLINQQTNNGSSNETIITTELSIMTNEQIVSNNAVTTWLYDQTTDKWKLNVETQNHTAQVVNSYYVSADQSVYCLDGAGNMVTGWLKDANNEWRYFEEQKTENEGKMATGWQNIGGYLYCFDSSGKLYINTITPDGYSVDANGRLQF